MDGLDFRDARLDRDDWLRYAERLGAAEGRRARLLRNKIQSALESIAPANGDAIVLALTRSDRVLLRELDQEELDVLLVSPTAADSTPLAAERDGLPAMGRA